jgi:uncharacterized protein (TIGR00369 family)
MSASNLNIVDDHFCFACGRDNPDGLRLVFEYPEEGRCRAEFVPARKFQGWQDILHGGIIAALLDEGFAHALGGANRGSGTSAVTAEMTVRYKKPAAIGRKLILEGRVVDMSRRVVYCEAVLRDESGAEVAAGTGKLIITKTPPG